MFAAFWIVASLLGCSAYISGPFRVASDRDSQLTALEQAFKSSALNPIDTIFASDAILRVGKQKIEGLDKIKSWCSRLYKEHFAIKFNYKDHEDNGATGTSILQSDKYPQKETNFGVSFKQENGQWRISSLRFNEGPRVASRYLRKLYE